MSDTLKISLVQSSLFWEDKTRNLDAFSKRLEAVQGTDLIILPEMFSTGFSMRSKALAEDMKGPTLSWMRTMATQKNAAVTGSFICSEGGKYYNRLVWMLPDGKYSTYDKRHLFRMGDEQKHYASGSERLYVDYKGWKICPMVCYDLRFPVWCRQPHGSKPFDLLLFVANWPERRSYPWRQLLVARAIENQAYVAAVNRVGSDGNGITHSGDSVILDPKGEPLSKIKPNEEQVETLSLSLHTLEEFRKQFPVGLDADPYSLS